MAEALRQVEVDDGVVEIVRPADEDDRPSSPGAELLQGAVPRCRALRREGVQRLQPRAVRRLYLPGADAVIAEHPAELRHLRTAAVTKVYHRGENGGAQLQRARHRRAGYHVGTENPREAPRLLFLADHGRKEEQVDGVVFGELREVRQRGLDGKTEIGFREPHGALL